jgi:hydrogenase maturation factor
MKKKKKDDVNALAEEAKTGHVLLHVGGYEQNTKENEANTCIDAILLQHLLL